MGNFHLHDVPEVRFEVCTAARTNSPKFSFCAKHHYEFSQGKLIIS